MTENDEGRRQTPQATRQPDLRREYHGQTTSSARRWSRVTFCTLCGRPCEYEVEPAVGDEPAVVEADTCLVAMRNGIYVDACFWCWFKWPDEHKIIPGQPLRESA